MARTPPRRSGSAPKAPPDLRRDIVARAIVDPAFRRRLMANPEAVFEAELNDIDKAAIERLRKMLPALDDIVTSLAGEVLCGGGGGCGGLA